MHVNDFHYTNMVCPVASCIDSGSKYVRHSTISGRNKRIERIDVLLLLFVWILLCCPPPISVLLRFMIAMIYAEIIRTSRVDWLIQEGRLEDHDGTDDFSMGASPPFPLNPAFKNARYGQN